MARKTSFRAPWLLVFALLLAGCSGSNNDGGTAATPSPTETASSNPSCATVSPNSPGEASCQAAGIPGSTGGDDRCSTSGSGSAPAGLIQGTFGPFCDNAVASTYNTDAIPNEAAGIVTVSETNADTTVQFTAQGFAPERTYSAQLHENACGAAPSDAGAEIQGPSQGTGGSGLAVDFTTDSTGNATATATVPWTLPDSGNGRSLLIFDEGGSGDGQAAGCMTLRQ